MIFGEFLRYFMFVLTACLLCIDTAGELSLHCISSALLTSLFIALPISLLPDKIRRIAQFVIIEGIILICLIDCYCQTFLGMPILPQIVSNVLQSDGREAREFLSVFIGIYVLLQWRIVLLLLLMILFPISFLIKLKDKPLSGRKKCIYASLCLLAVCFIYEAPAMYRFSMFFRPTENMQVTEGFIFRHYHEEISTPLHRFAYACHVARQSKQALAKIKQSTFESTIYSCSYASPHIVLIIGESYNKHHSSLYGYNMATTPLQEIRKNRGELYVLENVVTPWNITSNVFLEMFSTWEHGAKTDIGAYPLFPILFRRAGYCVNFFSNQYLIRGFRKKSTNQSGGFFLADGELSDSLFSYRNRKSDKYDMGIVNQVAEYKQVKDAEKYSLDIIHLIGQHFDYAERYPQSFSHFSEQDYKRRSINDEAKRIVVHYDNATFYNDQILDSILKLYEDDNAIVVFVADHGEEVYDDLPVHGRLFQEPTARLARHEFEVPMWIWCSDSYRANHQAIVSSIKKSLQKPFMTDGLPQMLLWLAGITSQWTEDNRNVLSPNYSCKPRIICGNTDYDSLVKCPTNLPFVVK